MGASAVILLGRGLKVNPRSGRTYVAESHLGGGLHPRRPRARNAKRSHSSARTDRPFFLLLTVPSSLTVGRCLHRSKACIIWPVSNPSSPSSSSSSILDCYPGRHRAFHFTGQIIPPEDVLFVCGAAMAALGGLMLSEETRRRAADGTFWTADGEGS